MKISRIILSLIILNISCSDIKKNKPIQSTEIDSSHDTVKKALETAYTWDIQKTDKGTLMFLDVGYQHGESSQEEEFLTLTVAKNKTKQRPEFINIILPNNIERSNGILIAFGQYSDKDQNPEVKLIENIKVKVEFKDCNNEDCTARLLDGFANREDGQKEDIFNDFLKYNFLFLLFTYPDGSHKSVMIPLANFKEQFRKIDNK
ncbi:hypothetical protein [Flavobacterium sp. SORGH_AS_0622]|uniref:hypothetical protein n=1 Tax=Flavobacterium sp. SORGH_AS_0622 TaxID=3041772 RepID=UPI00277EA419|nr:hypothetical protein [Flavobacterium sp. SORGH_AS_0622]MDQ1164331.1 hypothetical protein [Flavobacterium sp. SORGH_AS_0622]